MLIATAEGINGQPAVGATVTFSVAGGPDVGATVTSTTDSNGTAIGSFTSATPGAVDLFDARFTNNSGAIQISKLVQVNWRRSSGIVLAAPTTTPDRGTQ